MYTNEMIDDLNKFGALNILYIGRKYKLKIRDLIPTLKAIVADHENVVQLNDAEIYIEGRMPEAWNPALRKKYLLTKKPVKYRRIREYVEKKG